MSTFKGLTKAEEQIMHALWKIEKGFVKDILESLPNPKPHYNTVSTVLKILIEKGFVKVESIGNSNLYTPLVGKDIYGKASMKQLLKGYFNGSFANMLSFFAKEKDISLSELEELVKKMKKTE